MSTSEGSPMSHDHRTPRGLGSAWLFALNFFKILLRLLQLLLQLLQLIRLLRLERGCAQYQRGNQHCKFHYSQRFHKGSLKRRTPKAYAKIYFKDRTGPASEYRVT